jgi:hypothetical protein
MRQRNLVDLDYLSNGGGKAVYGGRLDAYSFIDTTCEAWFGRFVDEVTAAMGKRYFPVYRMADGEYHFLFGARVNWHSRPLRSLGRFVKYEVLKRPWKTSWNEQYSPERTRTLRALLAESLREIAAAGKLAIYWNKNAIHAFTEYNREMEDLFEKMGVRLNQDNYVPFHFGQALLAKAADRVIRDRRILIVCGMEDAEYNDLRRELTDLGAAGVELYRCPATSALEHDYTGVTPQVRPDIVLVAAGIGAARALTGLKHLSCPIIDIGSYIHVVAGHMQQAHSGFFLKPAV